jgi:hypothetical protein
VFENRVLRKIFGLKKDEKMGGWRKLYNEELHSLYSSTKYEWNDQVTDDKVGRECSTNRGEEECV